MAKQPRTVLGDRAQDAVSEPPPPVVIKSSFWETAVINGGIVSSPVWEEHPYRAKNWLAYIEAAPTSPGGLRRQFLPYGRGEFRYMVAVLDRFDAVEFAADYLSVVGNRSRKRWYGVVRELSPTVIAIEEVGSAVTALLRSVELKTTDRLARAAVNQSTKTGG